MEHGAVLFYLYARISFRLELLHGRDCVPFIVAYLLDLDSELALECQDVVFHLKIVNDFASAGYTVPEFDESVIVHALFFGLCALPVFRNEAHRPGVYGPVFFRYHRNARIIFRERQIESEPYTAAAPPGVVFVSSAELDLLNINISLDSETFIEDVAMLAKEVLAFILVKNCVEPFILKVIEYVLMIHRYRVRLE